MFCAISGQVPSEPVVSRKTGTLFEKRLIHSHLDSDGRCPVTGEDMDKEDLVEISSGKGQAAANGKINTIAKPRPLTATSIPGLIGLFQNEWDELMLETYTLKKHLDATRQELSQALYQHDAACRVIARLLRERDEARAGLTQLQSQVASGVAARSSSAEGQGEEDQAMAVETADAEDGLTAAILEQLDATHKKLSKGRKKRPMPDGLATVEDLKEYACTSTHTHHSASKAGILCLDLHPSKENLVLTGGKDKVVSLYDRTADKVVAKMSGHKKEVLSVKIVANGERDIMLSCGADKICKVWEPKGDKYSVAHNITSHTSDVTGCSVHATGDYFATCSYDKSWAFHNIETGKTLLNVTDKSVEKGFGCMCLHPDGLILSTGTQENLVRMWDLKTQSNVATFEGHTKDVTSVSFSENGYHMASGSADGTVRLWDLRKLKNIKILELGKETVNSVTFDKSGQHLACGAGNELKLFSVKGWEPIHTLKDHSGPVTGACFSLNSQYIASSSMDRSLKFFGKN